MSEEREDLGAGGIAIVGMFGRFPGAGDLDTFWRNLCDGTESISVFADDELEPFGIDPNLTKHPSYVKARGIIEDADMFDNAFFGYSGRDALFMDPQQRLFLEGCWAALEHAGYDPRAYKGLVGVYGGGTASSYHGYLYSMLDLLPNPDPLAIALGNELPFLTTRVSFKMDLKGPSCPVQTACSTSLVAVHLACQGLLNSECDMALAGGVSLRLPQRNGYFYQEENILSPDGHCRSFDAKAAGTVFSNGMGLVVLKRLDDAVADGDTIYAVIRGSAINNDGARRASFTAPGVHGQSHVVADALAAAGVSADTISYIEAHGTATSLGDSIELQALTKAFARGTSRKQYCAIGTVKANIGHLDAAAGVAGLIKAALMLRNRTIPPAAMFERPNPNLQIENTPFYVNTRLTEWQTSKGTPRRAGVSSFGFGGTNAHVVLEEAPAAEETDPGRANEILVLSAETAEGLERITAAMHDHLVRFPGTVLADAAHTLQTGRRAFRHRRAVVCGSVESAAALTEGRDPRFVFTGVHEAHERPVVFMFPGQGSQHIGMARDLHDGELTFRDVVDECADQLTPHLGADIRTLMFPEGGSTPEAAERLTRTAHAQPALFVVEYALARLYMSWGLQPHAMIGHSVGEWVAACLAGVLPLADALRLVALRGRLMEEMPAGVMTAVPLSEAGVRPYLGDRLWLAAVNASSMCVVSGAAGDIAALETRLRDDGIEAQRLQTSHAFHSGLMDAAVPRFVDAIRQVALKPPAIPFISCVSGALITDAEATDPAYWGRQIREAVRFSDGAAALLGNAERVFLEIGPGQALTTLMKRQAANASARVIPSLRRPQEHAADDTTLAVALARLWVAGAAIDWAAYHGDARRGRVPLPTYPFARQRHWVSRPANAPAAARVKPPRAGGRSADIGDWFYAPAWTRVPALRPGDVDPLSTPATWLVFADEAGVADACIQRLEAAGHETFVVTPSATGFAAVSPRRWTIDPFVRRDYDDLLKALASSGRLPDHVLHCWGTGDAAAISDRSIAMEREHFVLFWSLTLITQALADANAGSVRLTVLTTGVQDITGDEPLRPGKSTALGVCRVIPQEHPNMACTSIDLASVADALKPRAIEAVLREAVSGSPDPIVAYRGGHRWVEAYRRIALAESKGTPALLRERGVYLITGGLGDIALNFAEYLARTVRARLVLIGRTAMPDESTWDEYLRSQKTYDLTAHRIERLRRVQALGGEVLIVKADAADRAQLAGAFAAAETRFGAVSGVIHASGLVTGDAFRTILDTDEDAVRRQFQPKVDALMALDDVVRGRELDFCMLVSSLSVLLGGLRYAAYASANSFLDAAARLRNRSSAFPWITVNWDGWIRAEDEASLKAAGKPVAGFVMTGAEGAEAFGRILACDGGTQVVVSTGDLQARIDQWVRLQAAAGASAEAAPAQASNRLPRPSLQTEFVAPRGELERSLASVWQDLLGLERVGVNDSFFELGGDSLLGIQLVGRMKLQLGVKVSAVTLYEAPTVAALAALLGADKPGAPTAAVDVSRERGEKRRERKLRQLASQEVLGA